MKAQFLVNGKVVAERDVCIVPEIVSVGGAWFDGIKLHNDDSFVTGLEPHLTSTQMMECFEFHVNDGNEDEWEYTEDDGTKWGYKVIGNAEDFDAVHHKECASQGTNPQPCDCGADRFNQIKQSAIKEGN